MGGYVGRWWFYVEALRFVFDVASSGEGADVVALL
jgi:hypothetical protein